MTRIVLIVQKLISLIKNDPNYKIQSIYSFHELFSIIFYRGIQVLRGLPKKLFLKNSSGIIFCGRSVHIEHGYNISVGNGLILEDSVYMNALSVQGILLGRNVTIARNSCLICTGVISRMGVGITIGNNSAVGAQSFIGGQGGVVIGNDVIMGPGVRIFSENHIYENKKELIRLQGESRKGVAIGNNCWIGASSTILDGVKVGNGCVIAAGSVVTKNIPSNSVVAGVPARIIKTR
jgi:acetyltransferase-like isoleucine patch superfamily enzyme